MPNPSSRISGIVPSGKDGWEVHFAAWTRKRPASPSSCCRSATMISTRPTETVEACVARRARRPSSLHATARHPGAARGDGEDLDALHRRADHRRPGDRHAGRPVGALRRRARRARSRRPRGRRGALLCHLPRHVPCRRRRLHRGRGGCRRRIPAARRRDRGGADAEDQGDPHQHAEQPDRRGLFARLARRRSPSSAAGATSGCFSDEVYWTLGGGEHRLAARAARHGRAHAGHQLHVEEPRHDRLAHRLADRPGRADHAADQPQPRLHLRAQRFRQPRRRRGAGERLWRRARSPRSTPARRKVFLDAMRGINTITVRGSEGGMYVMLDIRAIEPDCEKFAWAPARRREGRGDAGRELRRGGGRPHPRQPLPA